MWAIQLPWSPRFHCGDTEPSLALSTSEMINDFFFYVHINPINIQSPLAITFTYLVPVAIYVNEQQLSFQGS